MSPSSRYWFAALSLSMFLAGCASEASSPEPTGSAPRIDDLTYAPNEAKVGESAIVNGGLTFEDVDGDVAELALEVRAPGSSAAQAMPRQRTDANGTQSGKIALLVSFVPPAAGDYEFAVYVVDAKGNESNRLTGIIQAK